MMPGLLPTTGLSLSLARSSSRAAERGAFPKPFNVSVNADSSVSAIGGPSTNTVPHGAKLLRVTHDPNNPMAQAMKPVLQPSRLNLGRQVASNMGACADARMAMRTTPECSSSGSDHDPSSVCLAAMVNEFMEDECKARENGSEPPNCLDRAMSKEPADIFAQLQNLACYNNELKEVQVLRDEVQTIVESIHRSSVCICSSNKNGCRRRMVMNALQRIGYDAAICKTKWDHSGSLPGGDYEYIDVLSASQSTPDQASRLLVDIEFQAQFEIARPSDEFTSALQLVPPIFVGRPDRLLQIVDLMAAAMRQSLAVNCMHLPPWRKLDYMKAKWFSAYKRTSNSVGRSRLINEAQSKSCDNIGGIPAGTGHGLINPACMKQLELMRHDPELVLTVDGRNISNSSYGRDNFITVMTTEWKPPPLESRPCSHTRPRSTVTGLVSTLLLPSAGLPACNNAVAEAA